MKLLPEEKTRPRLHAAGDGTNFPRCHPDWSPGQA